MFTVVTGILIIYYNRQEILTRMRQYVCLQLVWSVKLFNAANMCPESTKQCFEYTNKNTTFCYIDVSPGFCWNLLWLRFPNRLTYDLLDKYTPHLPKWTFVFLKGLMNEHVPLHLVLPVEHGLTNRTFVWLFSCNEMTVLP